MPSVVADNLENLAVDRDHRAENPYGSQNGEPRYSNVVSRSHTHSSDVTYYDVIRKPPSAVSSNDVAIKTGLDTPELPAKKGHAGKKGGRR